MSNATTDHNEEQPPEPTSYVRHFHPRKIHGNKSDTGKVEHRITITDAIKHMGLTEEKANNTSFWFDPEAAVDEDGTKIIPGTALFGDDRADGKTSKLARSLQVTGVRGENPAYSIGIPRPVLEELGFTDDDNRGELIDVYASQDGLLAFGEVETREIVAENDIDIINDILPPKAAEHYRKVVIEGKTIEEVGAEIEANEDLEDRSWPAKYQVKRNVEKAKDILDSIQG